MSIDYYSCNRCGDTFPDCGEYETCQECYTKWCTEECAKEDGAKYDEEDRYVISCKYCREEDLDDATLVDFMLEYFTVTREEMVRSFFVKLKENNNDDSKEN